MTGGSSPLTRGAQLSRVQLDLPCRLIPAHAGSTSKACSTSSKASAHPRSRGEHDPATLDQFAQRGSSPLTRGARRPPVRFHHQRRLIPAHAGSTRARIVMVPA